MDNYQSTALTCVGMILLLATLAFCQSTESAAIDPQVDEQAKKETKKPKKKIVKSDAEWRKQLSRMQYNVTRRGHTERARTGRYWRHKEKGTYHCICCNEPLFPSSTKYESGTGWPSFWAPIDKEQIATKIDRSIPFLGVRVEVLCRRCDAHLGHVFSDGPRPTGLRYCLNSAALKFAKRKPASSADEKIKEDKETDAAEGKQVAKPEKQLAKSDAVE